MHTAHILFFLLTLGTASAGSGYSKLTQNCAIVNIKNDKSKPGLECKCETDSGESVSCQAEFSEFLVNNHGKLQSRLNGAASATCTGFSLFETVLGADCGGKAVSLIDLDKTCGVDGSGKLSCGELTGTGSSTTSSAAESSSMAPISTEEATPASSGSKGSSVDSHSSTERTSGQSSNPGQNSASDVMTTTAAMSASTETAESCGVVEKRMRIMNR